MRKGTTARKTRFFGIFQTVTISRPQEPQASDLVSEQFGPSTSQIQRYKLQQASCPEWWAAKERHKMAIFERTRSPLPHRKGWGSEFLASVAGWWKNIHARFEVHSCYGSRDISVLKWKFGKCAKWSLFSYPVTNRASDIPLHVHTCTLIACIYHCMHKHLFGVSSTYTMYVTLCFW